MHPDDVTVLCHVIPSHDLCHVMSWHMSWWHYCTVSCCATWWHHRTVSYRMEVPSCRTTCWRYSTFSSVANKFTVSYILSAHFYETSCVVFFTISSVFFK